MYENINKKAKCAYFNIVVLPTAIFSTQSKFWFGTL